MTSFSGSLGKAEHGFITGLGILGAFALTNNGDWIKTIRPIRQHLRSLRDEKRITPTVYRKYYMKAKGGEFRSKHHLQTHMTSDGVIKEAEKQ